MKDFVNVLYGLFLIPLSLVIGSLYFVFNAWILVNFWNWFLDDITSISMQYGIAFSVVLFFYIYIMLYSAYAKMSNLWQQSINATVYNSMVKSGIIKAK